MVLDSSLKVCFVMLENFHSACRKQPGPLRFLLSDIKRCISLLLVDVVLVGEYFFHVVF